jgi:hypothetical protein
MSFDRTALSLLLMCGLIRIVLMVPILADLFGYACLARVTWMMRTRPWPSL